MSDASDTPHETDALSDDEICDRIIQLAFGGDRARWDAFVRAVREATPPDATIVLRGSVVTGKRWADGQPFDADGHGTSDLDLTLVGGNVLKLWKEFYVPGIHSVPLSDEHPEASPTFSPLRRALCSLAGRPVNIQATSDWVQYGRDILFDQPYYTIVDRAQRDDERARWEHELAEQRRVAGETGADRADDATGVGDGNDVTGQGGAAG